MKKKNLRTAEGKKKKNQRLALMVWAEGSWDKLFFLPYFLKNPYFGWCKTTSKVMLLNTTEDRIWEMSSAARFLHVTMSQLPARIGLTINILSHFFRFQEIFCFCIKKKKVIQLHNSKKKKKKWATAHSFLDVKLFCNWSNGNEEAETNFFFFFFFFALCVSFLFFSFSFFLPYVHANDQYQAKIHEHLANEHVP